MCCIVSKPCCIVVCVVFGVKYCCEQCIVFGWYNLFVNFYILFDLVGCILVCVCCLRRARALQNGASGGGAILPDKRALQNGAPGGEKSLQRAATVYSEQNLRFSAPRYSARAGDALSCV
jgi:hypothetical protein